MAVPRRCPVFLLSVLLSFTFFIHALAAGHHSESHLSHRDNLNKYGHGHYHSLATSKVALSNSIPPPVSVFARAASESTGRQGDYTCGPGKPCSNKACCGADGWCGYEPKYCGKGCQSNCDAKAECGKYAKTPGQECPLNVCCSQYGFCGTTSEFCDAKGCQSNCEQPRPSAPKSDSRQRVIGYWEGWNTDHACGTMTLGEIPVDMLTHLNIAFGYIDSDFKITNMDSVPPDLYKNVGNLKAKNPNLKIVIALGGWTFSDPGTKWQNIFPSLTSSQANRAAFIKNLLGFLAEYGYDGVDFDWEYPGAKDRGGSDKDAANYVSLVKELRAAIKSSGRDYIVTFTAPTSYWYLRHFDPKGMEPYVDWINLMSYDLHGTWDSDNPIGSQVLAHSNLTEIDLALDLFWRVGVKPQNIVLGLGFYGRSFRLKSPSCWKPGCKFGGPGDKGPCTDTAGILSYREIQNILTRTGATSYHDKSAAVRYFVYNDNSWISYDDKETFTAKIQYANKMGLSGLMIWAIDQDDDNLSALSAVTGDAVRNRSSVPFDLVDLKHLFPSNIIPADTSDPNYGIITFGAGSESGELDPTNSGFGFLLAVGDSHGLTQLRRRDGRPEPFVFLDCPEDVHGHPINKTQTARVVCTNQDVESCFKIMERGVEGTLVEMPDECAPNSFARAISLEIAQDQSIPEQFTKRGTPTSQVYEFSFDFNRLETRDDANIAVRMDVSNVKGYWDALVDSPGVETRDLETRYHSALNTDWKAVFREDEHFKWDSGTAIKVKRDLSTPIFWQAVENCPVDGEDYGEGIAVFVNGTVDAEMFYSVSVVATGTRGAHEVNVKEANGFIKVTGKTDLVLGLGGMGQLDIDQAGKGNPAKKETMSESLGGHIVHAGAWWGSMAVNPYLQREYVLATENGRTQGAQEGRDNAATFNGRLTTHVQSDFGKYAATFPDTMDSSDIKKAAENRDKTIFQRAKNDVLFSGGGRPVERTKPVDMLVQHQILAQWVIDKEESGKACMTSNTLNNFYQIANDGDEFGWEEAAQTSFFSENIADDEPQCWSVDKTKRSSPDFHPGVGKLDAVLPPRLTKRGSKNPLDNFGVINLKPNDALELGDNLFVEQNLGQPSGSIDCGNGHCTRCLDDDEDGPCCGCACMPCIWGARGDIPPCSECTSGTDGVWPEGAFSAFPGGSESDMLDEDEEEGDLNDLQSRARTKATIRLSDKTISVCGVDGWKPPKEYRYPAFPADPGKAWENADQGKYDSISRYWGNASADCTKWKVEGLTTADVVNVGNGATLRAPYETEHVYEAQLLGQFFQTWLREGRVTRQKPDPGTTSGLVDCDWIDEWITTAKEDSYPWENPANPKEAVSLLQLMQSELGNISHKDRLTISLGRLNNKKQNLFGHKETFQEKPYKRMSSDEQLQLFKEHGMLFNYMNDDTVWEMWCDSYKAMRDHLVKFDAFYPKGKDDPDVTLADEWDKYHRAALDSIVLRARDAWDWLYDNRGSKGLKGSTFEMLWGINYYTNSKSKVFHLKKECKNLPKTTIT